MGRKTATFALAGAMWLSTGLGACCSDEGAPTGDGVETAEVPKDDAAKDGGPLGEAALALKEGAGEAQPPGDGHEGHDHGEHGEEPVTFGEGEAPIDIEQIEDTSPRKPGDDQQAVDKLFELKAADVAPALKEAGWKVLKEDGAVIEKGHRFEVTKGSSKVRVELVEFDSVESADAYMFAMEKIEESRLGRLNNKMLAIIPSKKGDQDATAELMRALMPAPAAAEVDEVQTERPEGDDGKPRDRDVGGEVPFKGEDPSGGKPLEEPAPELEPTKVEEMPPPAKEEPAKEVQEDK